MPLLRQRVVLVREMVAALAALATLVVAVTGCQGISKPASALTGGLPPTGDGADPGTAADAGADIVLHVPDGIVDSCDVRSIGAVGDGVQLDTAAVQAAFDHCNTAIVPAGTYLVGPLFLRSNLTVQLDADATLVASTAMADFAAGTARNRGVLPSVINSFGVTNVKITGAGAIDGSGAPWWALQNAAAAAGAADPWRPHLMYLKNSIGVTVENIVLRNSPKFHILAESCMNMTFSGLTITAPSNAPNTDGIDPKSCKGVTITNCHIAVGDDNVAVTASGAPATDIMVSDCVFGSGHGVSIGSPTSGGISGMTVQHCQYTGTSFGIRIKTARDRGGEITNLVYDDLQMTNVGNAIYFTDYYPDIPKAGTDLTPTLITATTPNVHDIMVSNVTATGGRHAGVLIGVPESLLRNISFDNVNITATTGLEVRNTDAIHFTGSSVTVTSGDALILDENAVLDGL